MFPCPEQFRSYRQHAARPPYSSGRIGTLPTGKWAERRTDRCRRPVLFLLKIKDPAMVRAMAGSVLFCIYRCLCSIDESRVGITCTTLEGLGIVGREEGIAVNAYCLTEKS